MPTPETRKILITVKAYPNPSKKYGETICCAGIDMDTFQWIRLYPIPYRDLDESQKFKKYTVIEARCWKAQDDYRIESYKIDCDSIRLFSHFDTQKDKRWDARKKIVLPTVSPSFCKILEEIKAGKSLGVFKPRDIEFQWKKAQHEDGDSRQACYAQLSFWNKTKKAIEQIPFDFYYSFKCYGEPICPGHKLPIVDWEIGQAYRDWRYKYKPVERLLEKIKQRWLDSICAPKNDIYFYVGNMQRFREQFMVLGVFYPPK
jgi:hypothetical protein